MTYIRLDDETYNVSLGAGFDIDWNVFEDGALFAKAHLENREYYDTKDRPNADTQDGQYYRLTLGGAHALGQDASVRASAFAGRVDAFAGFESYSDYGGELRLSSRFDSPLEGMADLGAAGQQWSGTVALNYTRREFDAPNVIVAPTKREDDVIDVSATIAAPFNGGWSAFTTLGYQFHNSNLPNNRFDNASALIGATKRF